MNLREDIQRIKEIMGLSEQINPSSLPQKDNSQEQPSSTSLDKQDDSQEKDFSNSVVKDIVWRTGSLKLRPTAGGIWFAETKEDVEKFSRTFGGNSEGKPYYINLTNPYKYDDFWHGYVEHLDKFRMRGGGKQDLFYSLVKKGYDGMIIGYDTWNDSGDDNSVSSKQYVVFDPKNIKPATTN